VLGRRHGDGARYIFFVGYVWMSALCVTRTGTPGFGLRPSTSRNAAVRSSPDEDGCCDSHLVETLSKYAKRQDGIEVVAPSRSTAAPSSYQVLLGKCHV
jgi:hypothetical protein